MDSSDPFDDIFLLRRMEMQCNGLCVWPSFTQYGEDQPRLVHPRQEPQSAGFDLQSYAMQMHSPSTLNMWSDTQSDETSWIDDKGT